MDQVGYAVETENVKEHENEQSTFFMKNLDDELDMKSQGQSTVGCTTARRA